MKKEKDAPSGETGLKEKKGGPLVIKGPADVLVRPRHLPATRGEHVPEKKNERLPSGKKPAPPALRPSAPPAGRAGGAKKPGRRP